MNGRDESALNATIAARIIERASEVKAAGRRNLEDHLRSGDRMTVVSSLDAIELGMVYRTKPKASAVVSDMPTLVAWHAQHYPERLTTRNEIRDGAHDEAMAVLTEHAPHLLTSRMVLPDWALGEVRHATVAAKQACGPGGELDMPGVVFEPPGDGSVVVKPGPDADEAIAALWRAGRIGEDGHLLALPAGQEDAA